VSIILDAIKGFVDWFVGSMMWLANQIWSSIMQFFQSVFVNPVINFVNFIINRIREKLKGVIFIVITFPLLIKEVRGFVESPSADRLFKIILKPIVGWIASEVLSAIIYQHFKPISILPPVIPSVPPVQPYAEPVILATSDIRVEDELSLSLVEEPYLLDVISVHDSLTFSTDLLLSMQDYVVVEDELSLTLE